MNSTKNLTLKAQFKQWLEEEQKTDEMIAFATIPHILIRFDKRLSRGISLKNVIYGSGGS